MWIFDGIMIVISIVGLIVYLVFVARKKPIEIDPKKMKCYDEHSKNWEDIYHGRIR